MTVRHKLSTDSTSAKLPPNTKVYAIGDIHGRLDVLLKLQNYIQADILREPSKQHYVIYLGDYVDRGDNPFLVIDHLIKSPILGAQNIYLKGNHDASLLDFITGKYRGGPWFFSPYGMLSTLLSYGVNLPKYSASSADVAQILQEFKARLPKEHLLFLQQLKPYFVVGDYLFVHAGIKPNTPLNAQKEDDLLWIRDEFLDYTEPHEYIVVHGHTITEKPEILNNRIGIDTGAFMSGRLTLLILEDEKINTVDTLGI